MWAECNNFIPELINVSGQTVGVTHFENVAKAWTKLDQYLSEKRWQKLNNPSTTNHGTSLILGFGSSTNKAKEANNKNHRIRAVDFGCESSDLEKKFRGHLSVDDAKKIWNLRNELQPMTTTTTDVVTIHLQNPRDVDGITMDEHTPVVEFEDKKH